MQDMKSTREAFGVALLELAEEGLDVAAVTADTSKSMGVNLLKQKHPERCFDSGIAEQNMMMIAAGLAAAGKTAFAVSYSVFTSMRALEQLRTFICYPNLNVKVVAGLGGFSAGIEGVTHMALEDLGIVRCIPNLMVASPSDYYATIAIAKALARQHGPAYIRLGRDPSPVLFGQGYSFTPGKANVLLDTGNDIGIITTGIILSEVWPAARMLAEQHGVGVRLIEMPTLKPIDEAAIVSLAQQTTHMVTIEEHNLTGALYSAVCEVLCRHHPRKVHAIAAPDRFTQSGTPDELIECYGLNSAGILKQLESICET